MKLPYFPTVHNSDSIRSIHAIGSRHLGGAEAFFARLVRALNETGYASMAVVRSGSPLHQDLADVPAVGTGMRNGLDAVTAWRIRRLIRRHRPAIVQTYLGRASRLTRVPRGAKTLHVARLGGFYRINAYRHADAWVGNTVAVCDHLKGLGFPGERVFHIGNFVAGPASGSEDVDVRAELDIPSDSMVVFALGRFVEKKGFGDLLEAFARLSALESDRSMVLVLAGDGPLRGALEEQARHLRVADRVRWTGWVEEPGPYFRAADVFVCPSRHEPLGNVILEAWFHGAPVVTTRNQGAEELVTGGVDGLITPVADPEALAHAIRDLLVSAPERMHAMVEAGHRTVETRHSVEAVVQSYLELYERLPGLGRARGWPGGRESGTR